MLLHRSVYLIAAATALVGCGSFLTGESDDHSSEARPYGIDGGLSSPDDPITKDTNNDGHHTYLDGGVIGRRCAANAPFIETVDMHIAPSSPFEMNALLTFRMAARSDGATAILSFAQNSKDSVLTAATLTATTLTVSMNEVAALNSNQAEESAALSDDGLRVVFARGDKEGKENRTLWTSQRTSVTSPWSSPQQLSVAPEQVQQNGSSGAGPGGQTQTLLDNVSRAEPYVVGSNIYFTEFRGDDQQAGVDLFVGSIDWSSARLTDVQKMVSLSTNADEGAPVISFDELEAFYSVTAGNENVSRVFHATRPSKATPFSSGSVLDAPVNSANNTGNNADTDYPTWISPDGCDLYAIGTRQGADSNTYTLRRFRRNPL